MEPSEPSEEYQDIGNSTGAAMPNINMPHHRHPSESPLVSVRSKMQHFERQVGETQRNYSESEISHQDEELSDPDLQDEESGEELPQQPLQGSNHNSHDTSNNSIGGPMALNNFINPHLLAKFKMDPEGFNSEMLSNKDALQAIQAAMGNPAFMPFPFTPPTAYMHHSLSQQQHHPPNSHTPSGNNGGPANNNSSSGNAMISSASSHSSESSQGSARNGIDNSRDTSQNNNSQTNGPAGNAHQQQTSWSFEEQFKQLYELNDDPKRKEFLDDLFSFMQKKGSPINRLPIMAKQVLDLYELYNLVIARGGLVDVINKKLWQEIIKGLQLPSSITSAAFTLRTQYMKYLYPYECEKEGLSTPTELQAAIDGNRREGRRSSYGPYTGGSGPVETMMTQQRVVQNPLHLHSQMSPLSLVTAAVAAGHHNAQALVNGASSHPPFPQPGQHPQHPQGLHGQPPNAGLAPVEFDARVAEYVKMLKEFRTGTPGTPPSHDMLHRQNNTSPTSSSSPRDGTLSITDFSRFSVMYNMYNNNNALFPGMTGQQPTSPQRSQSPLPAAASPEPQREALDLGLRSSPMSSSPIRNSAASPDARSPAVTKRERDLGSSPSEPANKRPFVDGDFHKTPDAHIKIANRGDKGKGDNSIVVSMDINGIMYQGVLFAQDRNSTNANSTAARNSS